MPSVSEYTKKREERNALVARIRKTEFFHDVSDAAEYVSMNIGIAPGQATKVIITPGNEHGTAGAVHVAVREDGGIVVAIEAEPGVEIIRRRVIRRPRWRFYDFWRWDKEKHDNVPRPEEEWPVLEEVEERPLRPTPETLGYDPDDPSFGDGNP